MTFEEWWADNNPPNRVPWSLKDVFRECWITSRQYDPAINDILDLINDWQKTGRNGHCLPVINGEHLEALEDLADDRRRLNCNFCHGSGKVDSVLCAHCAPLKFL